MRIGITGSLASGKTTASKILSYKRGPLFSADKVVKDLYHDKSFKRAISKKFKINNNNQIKKTLKKLILSNKKNIKKLEKIIHPLVRRKMKLFTQAHKNRKLLFYEIPLLIESKLMNKFDLVIFIKANKILRSKRFKSKKGNKNLFKLLDSKQLKDSQKIKHCDIVVINKKNLTILKKKLNAIIQTYE